MGLKMQLRVSWGLVNLYVCAIAVGLTIPGSSGSVSPVWVEASSVAPTQATAVTPDPGPLLNGPTLQPPIISLPLDSPPPLPAETPQQQQNVSLSTPPPASEPPQVSTPPLDTKPPEAVAPMPIIDPPPQASPPPESKPTSSPQTPGAALPPSTVPLPINPPQPLPSPIVPPVPPQASPTTSSAPPPLELPPMSPPPSSTLPGVATPPYVSSPPPLMMSPPSPPPSTIPSQTPPPLMMSPPAPPPSTIPSQTPPPLISSPPPSTIPIETPPPLMMSPPAPPPSTIPSQTPPPLVQSSPPSTIPRVATPPYASSPPPLMMSPPAPPPPSTTPSQTPPPLVMSPPAPPPSSIPSHTPYAPPPLEESPSSVPPPSSTMQAASPPRGSPKEEVHSRAPPPVQDSPDPPPSSSVAPLRAPPRSQATPETNPPMSHQMGAPAPKHSAPSVVKTNASEPHSPPSPAQVPTMAPPGKAPVELSPAVHPSPRHEAHHNRTPSDPKFERHNETAPAPFSLPKPPPSRGSHLSPRHSPVKGSPMVEVPPPSASETPEISPTPSTVGRHSFHHSNVTLLSPRFSPPGSSGRNATKRVGPSMQALPPPPPNQDCGYLTCPAPFTNTPTGSPCGCVWPMQVGLRLSMALYTFFPLVSELAEEIAAGLSMKPSQVRVMGAESGAQDPDKIIVLVDLVPFHEKFDDTTASLTFQRFWHKQVHLDKSIFGDYDVLYVHYPGLPPSPPLASADAAVVNSMPYSVVDNNRSTLHPLGVKLPQRQNHKLNASLIAVIVFSAIVGVMICFSVAWLLILRYRNRDSQTAPSVLAKQSLGRSSGPTGHSTGSAQSSFSAGSSLGKYPGSAKTFTTGEMEKATDNFNPSRILGEGGFGCVYSGTLEDGTSVAVKVLKRDDKQGGREFLAEIEMLNRVHHRNLVKLIGICVDDSMRCLVYELVPNGSVESHLHGVDKEAAPLDWSSRLKIALGAARGLAYLHEDSSPGVIHRDFKSSNILLEDDFTPKVSDFGLARCAMTEENRHISTQIMGTFGYVAPEYAMTGHLLAKSDVYSYGVVLLELLTGRRPIDMLQPPGEENLVAWARPHLTNKQGLESIIDPCLLSSDDMSTNLESVAKVAAIASMCVQPEVSHRPFMGEVVQALKLVSNEEENASKEEDDDNNCSGSPKNMSSLGFDAKMALLLDDVEKGSSPEKGALSMSGGFEKKKSSPVRRISSSGPMRNAKGGGSKLWEGIRKWSHGSRSEHGTMYRLWRGSH